MKSYPFLKSDLTAVRWAYALWLLVGTGVAFAFGILSL
jgi:hypothetical protein